jgi:hypothetical protein
VTIRPAKGTQSTDAFARAQISDGVQGEITTIHGTDVFVMPSNLCLGASARFIGNDAEVLVFGGVDSSVAQVSAVAANVISHTATK